LNINMSLAKFTLYGKVRVFYQNKDYKGKKYPDIS